MKVLSEIYASQKHATALSIIHQEFYNLFEFVCIDIDFSDNLTLPVKHQAQSLHWSSTKVAVHSRIIKVDGENIFHIHLSENHKHVQTFVKIVLHDMLNNADLTNKKIIMESDNCSSKQYKSVKHFYDLQELTNIYQTQGLHKLTTNKLSTCVISSNTHDQKQVSRSKLEFQVHKQTHSVHCHIPSFRK